MKSCGKIEKRQNIQNYRAVCGEYRILIYTENRVDKNGEIVYSKPASTETDNKIVQHWMKGPGETARRAAPKGKMQNLSGKRTGSGQNSEEPPQASPKKQSRGGWGHAGRAFGRIFQV